MRITTTYRKTFLAGNDQSTNGLINMSSSRTFIIVEGFIGWWFWQCAFTSIDEWLFWCNLVNLRLSSRKTILNMHYITYTLKIIWSSMKYMLIWYNQSSLVPRSSLDTWFTHVWNSLSQLKIVCQCWKYLSTQVFDFKLFIRHFTTKRKDINLQFWRFVVIYIITQV